MNANSNRAIVERFLQAARERDLATMRALSADDIRVIEADSLPYGGEHVGLDAFLELSRQVFRQLGITELRIERIIPDEDLVVVLATIRGTPPGMAPFEMPITEIWQVQDGRIREIRPFYMDTHLVVALVQPHARA
jgi:ketosteroid isomerase-like protein